MELEEPADTTTLSYWLNWRVLLCAIWVLTPMVLASLMMWKYELPNTHLTSDRRDTHQGLNQPFCDNEAWRPCFKQIHPVWLLGFRLFAFLLLLATSIFKVLINGGRIFLYYTQADGQNLAYCLFWDEEHGSYMPLVCEKATNGVRKRSISNPQGEDFVYRLPGIWNYVFEIMFQMNAGAVMLTVSVYWFIIFPFLTIQDYNLNFMTIDMHTVSVILLLGETALNCLWGPFFRISFFVLWTGVFVIFQWIIHVCVSIWWPYPFLDFASPYAPLWYLLIGIMHIPCYGIYTLIVKTKHYFLAKWFPSSCQY